MSPVFATSPLFAPSSVHVVVPNDIDDPAAPSGGNAYDRRVCRGLVDAGWSVREHAVRGSWPRPRAAERAEFARVLASLPDDAVVLVDGLIASTVPDALAAHRQRLRLVVVVHMPLGGDREREALGAAVAVVTTSSWSRRYLLHRYALPAGRVHVAAPGVDEAPLVSGSATGSRLLCVAAVAPHKGHDVLVQALAAIPDLRWRCVCVGSLERDPEFAEHVHEQAQAYGIADRISFVGARTGAELDAQYAAADLLVLASHGETYGMVITEALARGIPVLATAANGLPEALGHADDGSRPGLLVAPGAPTALAGALRRWLAEPELRGELRRCAAVRRTTLTGWAVTATLISNVLSTVATKASVVR